MRGKLKKGVLSLGETRITPADAGKTCAVRAQAKKKRDHPRGCGENIMKQRNMLFCRGSPPRMRGKLRICRKCLFGNRITPADAGKTKRGFKVDKLS